MTNFVSHFQVSVTGISMGVGEPPSLANGLMEIAHRNDTKKGRSQRSGSCSNIKTVYKYRYSHYKNKTVMSFTMGIVGHVNIFFAYFLETVQHVRSLQHRFVLSFPAAPAAHHHDHHDDMMFHMDALHDAVPSSSTLVASQATVTSHTSSHGGAMATSQHSHGSTLATASMTHSISGHGLTSTPVMYHKLGE